MLEPIIGFFFFFFVIFLLKRSSNKNREKLYRKLLENIKPETKFYIEQTKSSTLTWGIKNRNFLFNRCDIYLTESAIIILGFNKHSYFKELSLPIILTKEIGKYANEFSYCYLKKVNKITFENNIVEIYFGKKGILQTEVTIKLVELNESELKVIKLIAEKNSW